MKITKLIKLVALAALAATALHASKEINIGSGGNNGNYYTVAQDIVEYCSEEVKTKTGYSLRNIETEGSVDNLQGILNKKYSIGFVQEDVLNFFKKKDQLETIDLNTQKFLKLYPEYLTILIPRNWEPKFNGGFFSKLTGLWKDKQPISIRSLSNQVVYAKGGALVSTQALSFFMNLNLKIIDASKSKISGPFIFVTGSGDPRIQAMLKSGNWWLLSFNGNELANKASFYKPARITYIVKGKTVTANTVSIMSIAYNRKYRSKKRQNALKELKQCVKSNIDDLIDDGSSNKWSLIGKINGWSNEGENDE